MNCNCETHEQDCVDARLPLTRVLNGSCVDIGLLVEDSNTLDLTAAPDLTAEVIASAHVDNVFEVRANGLYVPNPFVANESGAGNQTWTETSTSTTTRQSTTLVLPTGTWFVYAWWSAWCKKRNDSVGDTELHHRLQIDGTDGPVAVWDASDMTELVIQPRGRVSMVDHWATQVAGSQTITVSVATAIGTSGTANQVEVFASRVQALATLRS